MLPGLLVGIPVRSFDASYFFHGLYPPTLLFSVLGRQRNAEFRPPGGGLGWALFIGSWGASFPLKIDSCRDAYLALRSSSWRCSANPAAVH